MTYQNLSGEKKKSNGKKNQLNPTYLVREKSQIPSENSTFRENGGKSMEEKVIWKGCYWVKMVKYIMFDAFNFPFFPLQLINEFHSSSLPTLETNGWWCWSEGWSGQLQRITRGWVFAHITSGDLLLGAEHCATSNQTKRHGGAEDDDGDLNVVVLALAQMPKWRVVMISAVCLSPPGRNYLLWKGCLCPTFKATYVPEFVV